MFLSFELEKRWLRSESGRIEGNNQLPHNGRVLIQYPFEAGMSKQCHKRLITNLRVCVCVYFGDFKGSVVWVHEGMYRSHPGTTTAMLAVSFRCPGHP